MIVPFVDLKAQYQSIKPEIDKAIARVLTNTAFIGGNEVVNFEKDFAKLCRVKYAIGVANGTDALFIALKALGIGQGDEVITVANSFIATSEAITAAAAKVVFVDCHPNTYTIDVVKIEEKVTSKTKAIIAVHLYGQPADMDTVVKIAKKHNLKIIEDAAQAHLASYNSNDKSWQKIGNFSDFTTFSFYPGKNLGAYGDAGTLVTNDDNLAKKAKMLANHGRIEKYNHEIEGYNSRLDGLQAAILSVKLKYIEKWTEKRRQLAIRYNTLLKETVEIKIPEFNADKVNPVWHLYVIRTKERASLQAFLKEKGISTGVHYPIALPNLKAYTYLGHRPSDFPIASAYQDQILSLPIFPELTITQQNYIVESVKSFFNN